MGCALRALAESRKAAALLGIDVEGLFRMTSVIASLLGGVAGVLIALYTNAVFPQMGQPMLHKDCGGHPRQHVFRALSAVFSGRRSLSLPMSARHARCRGVQFTIRNSTTSSEGIVGKDASGTPVSPCGRVQGSKVQVGRALSSSACGTESNY
jgi:hypothetical protein